MKIHWLIPALLLFATGCKPQQPEPLAIKVKPLPDTTQESSNPVVSPTIAPNASTTKAENRSSVSVNPSPKASPTPTTTSQKASSTRVNTRQSPSVSPSPKASPTPKTITSASEAVLTATNPKSRINLRSSPSTTSKRLGYGTVGDRVQIIEQKTGTDGDTWYKVRFPRSSTQGWIRKDLVKVTQKQPPSKSGVPLAPTTPTPTQKPSPKTS
jgi:hypothetical protein